jgi:hypothetical protein
MPFSCRQTVAPSELPVSLAIAKSHLRVTWTDDDSYISELIEGATDSAQREAPGLQLVTSTWVLTLDDFPRLCGAGWPAECASEVVRYPVNRHAGAIRLPVGPVVAVASITYRDAAGVVQTLDPASYDVGARTGRVAPVSGWPTVYAPGVDNVSVTFTAGFGAASAVPAAARDAIRLILADRWSNRGDNVSNFLADRDVPAAARRLMDNLRDGYQW